MRPSAMDNGPNKMPVARSHALGNVAKVLSNDMGKLMCKTGNGPS